MEISEEDKVQIRKFVEAKNRSYRVSASQVTELYNRVLNKTARPTSCGSCIRARICDLERWLNQYEIDEEKQKKKEDKTIIVTEEKPKRGRPKKEKEE